jgi:hypothetical protein
MKNLTAEQLQENFLKLVGYIDTYIPGDRGKDLKMLYNDHAERIMLMPASGNENYHNCFVGGYVDHVIRVIDSALELAKTWKSFGATESFTTEELVFAALNHDLGKIGTEENEMYIMNDSEWHRKNQGKIYKMNPANAFMTVPDRSLRLLAERGISVSENEWFGIKLHDGMYDESNRHYYISHDPNSRLRTNLPYILHQADQLAARIEYEMWVAAQSPFTATTIKHKKANVETTTALSDDQKEDLMAAFNNLFK